MNAGSRVFFAGDSIQQWVYGLGARSGAFSAGSPEKPAGRVSAAPEDPGAQRRGQRGAGRGAGCAPAEGAGKREPRRGKEVGKRKERREGPGPAARLQFLRPA